MDKDKLEALKLELDKLDDGSKDQKIADLEAKVQKLEEAPVDKSMATFEVGPPDEYKGFRFHKQGD